MYQNQRFFQNKLKKLSEVLTAEENNFIWKHDEDFLMSERNA